MNPYAILVALFGFIGAFAGGWWTGSRVEQGTQKRVEDARRETADAAEKGAAKAIAQIKVTQTTIRQRAEKEIIREPQYVDPRCEQSDAVYGLLLRAYDAQRAGRTGDRGVQPGAPAAAGQEFGSDDAGAARGGESLF